ncbi:glycosyltransferase family 15 protein, partial [[Candida] arabinofermentans NRRL YB-2248]
HDMIFGFVNAPAESIQSAPSLFKNYKTFMQLNNELLIDNSTTLNEFILDSNTNDYTNCNFDSNFEIVNLEFYKSKEYKQLYDFMDDTNGFFYERWTDYSIKTLAISTFVPKDKIFWLDSTGYHDALDRISCPYNLQTKLDYKCYCNDKNDYSFSRYSCMRRFFDIMEFELPEDVPLEIPKYKGIAKYKRLKIRDPTENPFEDNYIKNNQKFVKKFM